MSELKGLILGIILVIVMFGIIGVGMKEVFSSTVDSLTTKIDTALIKLQ